MAYVLQQIQGDDHKIPSGSVLWEAIVWDELPGCLPWPSVSSSLQALNRMEKSTGKVCSPFALGVRLVVCLFISLGLF